MAQKRMFDKTITNSDEFLELPDSSQVLYFHLSMNADDDGFVNNWKSILRMTGTKQDDLKILITKSFVIPFESGVIVIKHWRINNFLRKDRHIETKYKNELNMLICDSNDEYILKDTHQMVNQRSTQYSIEENSIDNNNIYTSSKNDDEDLFKIEFEKLWTIYPKKQGKKDALKHFVKARKKGIDFDVILKGLENYNEYIKKTNKESKYIKQGSTWFNQECWNDEYNLKETKSKEIIPEWFGKEYKKDEYKFSEEDKRRFGIG